MKSRLLPAVAFTLGLAVCVPPFLSAQAAEALRRLAGAITAAEVSRHVSVIADDSMEGRATGSRGLELTAQYVAKHFEKAGLKPGGDRGTWFQRYSVAVPAGADDTALALSVMNTVGILEGSDPRLKEEYIVIVAHMDHVGVGRGNGFEEWRGAAPQPPDDSIYNGADDNASGTAGLIELAKAFAQPGARPRRSLIFLGTGAEEGVSSSSYFLDHPPVPLKQLVAAFNMDMIGRLQRQNTIFVKGGQYSDLLTTVNRVVSAHPELRLSVVLPTDGIGASDHVQFAERKIPILFFNDGGASDLPHPDYHAVTDTPEKITADGTADVLRLIFCVGQEVANADQPPKWSEEHRQGGPSAAGNEVP